MEEEKYYLAIDLKSFYASVEAVDRGLDPLDVNLVVADESRTEKTICLAVSPALKSYGIPGRARLFEVVQKVKEVNSSRRVKAIELKGKSVFAHELNEDSSLEVDYVVAPPRMRRYMEVSNQIYEIYLKYVSAQDIHIYSVDEVFIDITPYLAMTGKTPRQMAELMIGNVLDDTGITATCGIGTNLYLAKIAMDIVAKHIPADERGVRIAFLDEKEYRRELWDHEPITDFWRVGGGTAKRLMKLGIHTMGDICRCSLGRQGEYYNEDLLYKAFGINAELLIDHAWGWEPTRISDIKGYKPQTKSISSGQVLTHATDYETVRLIVKEMADLVALDLVDKGLVTNMVQLAVGYDIECLTDPAISKAYKGPVDTDRYGRRTPKGVHGLRHFDIPTSSSKMIMNAVEEIFDEIYNPILLARRLTIAACNLAPEDEADRAYFSSLENQQLDLFTDYEALERKQREAYTQAKKERSIQHAILDIQHKYGKNALLKGMNLSEGGTTIERNGQVGGHKG